MTTTTSMRDLDNVPEGQTSYGQISPENRPGRTDEAKLDAAVSKALEHFPDTDAEPAPDKRPLDEILTDNLGKHYEAKEDESDFKEALPSVDELGSRYKDQGEVLETLQRIVDIVKAAKQDPRGVGLALAEAYGRLGPWSATDSSAKEMPAVEYDHTGRRLNGKRLDFILEQAADRATSDKKLLADTAEIRAELKQLLPGKSFKDAVKLFLQFDTEARRDPVGANAHLAAINGMAWTPRQQAAEQEQHVAAMHVAEATKVLPGMQDKAVKEAMAYIIQSDPRFQHMSEVDAINASYQMVMNGRQHQQQGLSSARQSYDALVKEHPQLALDVLNTIEHDKAFQAHVRNVSDPQEILQYALGWTQARRADVAKAARVKAVKSSSGSIAPSGGAKSGMDSAISAAMSKYSS
jgi:hypothetical protein